MAIAQTDTITPLLNLASLFLGKSGSSSTSGGSSTEKGTITNTVQESVPQAAVDAAIKSILEGTQGLAAVTSGQKVAGLYNSSTNTLLANDLVARAAAQGAALNKTTTTTQNRDITTLREPTVTSQTTNPQISPTTGLGILGALQVLPTVKDSLGGILAKKKFKVDDFEDAEPGGNVTTGSSGIDTATGIPAVEFSASPVVDVASIAQATGLDEGLLSAGTDIVDTGIISDGAVDFGSAIGSDILSGDAGDWLSNAFNNFEFARGGLVKGYADGGIVGPNTGLRPTAQKGAMSLAPESNNILSDALLSAASQLAPVIDAVKIAPKTSSSTSSTKSSASSPKKETPTQENIGGTSSSAAPGTTPGSSNSGLDVSASALSALNALAGITAPGLAGLATSSNNSSAVNSFASSNVGLVGGLAAGLPGALLGALLSKSLLNQLNPEAAAAPTSSAPVGTPVEGSIAVTNPNGGMQSTTPGMIDALGLLGVVANQSINPGIGQASISSGGLSAESGGVSDSSGNAVGTDGDGGVGAGAAMQNGGRVPGDDPTHSDMVPAKLTNGEFVVNRNATKAFLPVLELLNNMIPATPAGAR